MRLRVNGEEREVPSGTRLDQLLDDLGLDPARVATERNGEIVRRSDYGTLLLLEDDELEVVTLVGGG